MKKEQSKKRWDEALRRLPKIAEMAEVGTWQGKMSFNLLLNHPGLTLYMIDRWRKPASDDSYSYSGSDIATRGQDHYDAALHRCVEIAQKFLDRAHIIKSDSAEAAGQFKDGSLDMVFIDGDHSYEGCKRDIIAWLPKVKKGGFIGGHDYAHPDQGNVKQAVDEIIGRVDLGGNRTWWKLV